MFQVCEDNNANDVNAAKNKKVLLVLLPFWTPLIPPMGISCLKSFLQEHNYIVRAVDANVEMEFKEINEIYFEMLKEVIPGDKRQHLRNVGYDVFRNQLMAHINYEDETEYIDLIKILVYQTFFYEIGHSQVLKLVELVEGFYQKLENYILNLVEEEMPGVLGLSVYSDTLPASLFVFKKIKEKYPFIRTVMGGGVFAGELALDSPNFNFFLQKTPYIDHIIVGEGEELFLKLLQGELSDSQKVFTLNDIKGKVLDLNLSGLPDFSDLELTYYPFLAAHASRSCPFQCSFCCETMLWGKYRKKNAKKLVEELLQLYGKHGTQLFLMCDSLLNPVITEIALELNDAEISVYWDGYLRVDRPVCNTENTMMWRKGGFYRARLGVESGSQRVLDAMGKKITPEQIKEVLFSLAYAGIKTTTYWVIGHPGETEADFRQTLKLIEELKDEIYEADCNPFSYFPVGQVNSDKWSKEKKSILLYPGKAKDMLIAQTWILNEEPPREEVFGRINRFVEHCNSLGIPNPYTLQEIYQADNRWKRLHKNATPSLVEFMKTQDGRIVYIDENKRLRERIYGYNILQDDGNWGF